MRILLKWIAGTIFITCFWTVEYALFFLPTSLIKLFLGFWILDSQYYGEYMLFGTLSDKLEIFENFFMKVRNRICFSLISFQIWVTQKVFKLIKYIPNTQLAEIRESLQLMDSKIRKEEALR